MGKSKRKRNPKPCADPIVGRPGKTPSDPESVAIRDQKILPVLSQLSSPDSKSRSTATGAIANLIEDRKCRKLLLKEQLVRLIMEQTLTDSEMEVVVAGWGVLRNLVLEEDWSFGVHLYRQDILSPAEAAIKSVISILESTKPTFSNVPVPRQKLTWELAGSLIGLLSSLSETNQELVDAISNLPDVPRFLFGLLGFEGVPEHINDSAILCLHALTEENDVIVKKIFEGPGWLAGLSRLRNEQSLQGIAACGIIHNISQELRCFDRGPDTEQLLDSATLPALKLSLEKYAQYYVQANGNLSRDDPQSSRIELSLRLALEILASIATAAQEGIEGQLKGTAGAIEADAMSEDSGDDNDTDGVFRPETGVANHVDGDAEMELVTGDESVNVGMSRSIASGSHEGVIACLIEVFAPLVLPLATPPITQATEIPPVYSRALSALNNISWTASLVLPFREFSLGKEVWTSCAQRIWKQAISPILRSNTADVSLADSIASLAWALSRSVGGKIDLAEGEHRSFMALYQAAGGLAASASAAQTNDHNRGIEEGSIDSTSLGVKCIGVLGTLALCPLRIHVNREVGVFLVTLLANLPQTPTGDAVEALNQLFDIYADKEFDYDEPVFWGDGLLAHLEAAIPNVKKMAKAVDKRKRPDLRERADEALMNLGRFVKYKKDEKAGRC